MQYRKLGRSDLQVSEISLGSWLTYSRPEQVHANAAASGIVLSKDVLDAVDEALGDVPVKGQALGPLATEGVKHRR
jgi:aryl-alcohol dehydrogenase-like predicted oxidoreductase